MSVNFRVCVYCASSDVVDVRHRRVAAELGRAIAGQGWGLVYGGGSIGLMGEVARAALSAGAEVVGVIPNRLADREIALERVTELIRTETLRERKALMDERSDAFVVLPGGIGTLEELLEIMTLKQLGFHDRAIVVLDDGGYWGPLLEQFRRMVAEGLAGESVLHLVDVVPDAEGAVAAIHRYQPPAAVSGQEAVEVQLESTESQP
jgi:uncharacterized protein (TIGR00730 family)